MQPYTTLADVECFVLRLRDCATGKANAKTARELRARYGYHDRTLRALVHGANEAGHLVVAGNDGYYVPLTEAEVLEPIGRLRSQGLEMLARARQMQELAAMAFDVPTPNGRLF